MYGPTHIWYSYLAVSRALLTPNCSTPPLSLVIGIGLVICHLPLNFRCSLLYNTSRTIPANYTEAKTCYRESAWSHQSARKPSKSPCK